MKEEEEEEAVRMSAESATPIISASLREKRATLQATHKTFLLQGPFRKHTLHIYVLVTEWK